MAAAASQRMMTAPGFNPNTASAAVVPAPDSPAAQAYKRWYTEYLSNVSLNVVIAAAIVAVLVHMAVIIVTQTNFEYSTILEIVEGPLLIVLFAGIVGASLLASRFGSGEINGNPLYIAMLVGAGGLGAWAYFSSPETINNSTFGERPRFEMSGILVTALVFVGFIVFWMSGSMRLDALSRTSMATIVFLIVCAVISYGLSVVFATLIRTVDFLEPGHGINKEFYSFFAYVTGVGFMALLVAGSIRFLDFLLNSMSGMAGPLLTNVQDGLAVRATYQTMRAFRLAVYSIIFVSAALMWRRRQGIQVKTTSTDLVDDWLVLLGMVFLVPVIAMAVEFLMDYLGKKPLLYEVARALCLGLAFVYIGTSYIPWNMLTLTIMLMLAAQVVFHFISSGIVNTSKLQAAFLCGVLFVAGNFFFRGADKALVDSGRPSHFYQVMVWTFYLLGPALYLNFLVMAYNGFAEVDARNEIYNVYTAFLFFYTLVIFFGKDYNLPGPYYEISPENEIASMAIDGVLVAGVVFFTASVWEAVLPRSQNSFDFKPNASNLIGSLMIGFATTWLFIELRKDRNVVKLLRDNQTRTDRWYANFLRDINS